MSDVTATIKEMEALLAQISQLEERLQVLEDQLNDDELDTFYAKYYNKLWL